MDVKKCIICNGSNARLCSSCHSISYCSGQCQKDDWPLHKLLCKAFSTFPARPSPLHKLAIHCPLHAEEPQLIWVECEKEFDEEYGTRYEMPDTAQVLNSENLKPNYGNGREFKPVTCNALRGFNLDNTVQVICRETFQIDGSAPNACVRRITKGRMTHDWRGPVLIMRQPGTAIDPLIYVDVTAGDLRVAVDYFLSY